MPGKIAYSRRGNRKGSRSIFKPQGARRVSRRRIYRYIPKMMGGAGTGQVPSTSAGPVTGPVASTGGDGEPTEQISLEDEMRLQEPEGASPSVQTTEKLPVSETVSTTEPISPSQSEPLPNSQLEPVPDDTKPKEKTIWSKIGDAITGTADVAEQSAKNAATEAGLLSGPSDATPSEPTIDNLSDNENESPIITAPDNSEDKEKIEQLEAKVEDLTEKLFDAKELLLNEKDEHIKDLRDILHPQNNVQSASTEEPSLFSSETPISETPISQLSEDESPQNAESASEGPSERPSEGLSEGPSEGPSEGSSANFIPSAESAGSENSFNAFSSSPVTSEPPTSMTNDMSSSFDNQTLPTVPASNMSSASNMSNTSGPMPEQSNIQDMGLSMPGSSSNANTPPVMAKNPGQKIQTIDLGTQNGGKSRRKRRTIRKSKRRPKYTYYRG